MTGASEFEKIIQNPNNYMKEEMKGALSQLIILSNDKQKLEKRKLLIFRDELKLYDNILNNSIDVANCLDVKKNVFSYFIIFSFLVWNGYFSVNKKFNYQKNEVDYVKTLEFLNIFSGIGDCKSLSSHLNNIYKKLHYDSTLVVNDIATIKIKKQIPINRHEDNEIIKPIKFSLKRTLTINNTVKEFNGKHISNLVKYKGKYYIIDSTNLAIFKIIDENTIKRYNAIGTSYISPWGFIVYDGMNLNDIKNLYKNFIKSNNPFITEKELNEIINETINECLKNISLFNDFFYQNKNDMFEIQKSLRLKNRL